MTRRLKVVVADDELDTREYLQEYLTHLGHDVVAAEDGHRLLEACRTHRPDLVVTDFAMPGLDGLAAAAEVNRGHPVPVILMTGRHDAEEASLAAAHVVRFLPKPVKNAELKEAVEAVASGEECASCR
jgi:CheY-like chemotaxis protein